MEREDKKIIYITENKNHTQYRWDQNRFGEIALHHLLSSEWVPSERESKQLIKHHNNTHPSSPSVNVWEVKSCMFVALKHTIVFRKMVNNNSYFRMSRLHIWTWFPITFKTIMRKSEELDHFNCNTALHLYSCTFRSKIIIIAQI